MILQALYELYQRLLDDPTSGVAPPNYSKARVSFALNISPSGELLEVIDLRADGKKAIPRDMDVPRQVKRASGIKANFLCDNSGYVLGVDAKGKPERSRETFAAFRGLHREILACVGDAGAAAVLKFLEQWQPEEAQAHPRLRPVWDDLLAGGNIIFKLDGTPGYIHERPALREAWEQYSGRQSSDRIGQCLVTGDVAPVARLHDSIKGVPGAQPTGAALVSFNLKAFTSYGKDQSFNAPVSEQAAFGYVTALNYLLRSDRHRLRISDMTTVFWADRSAALEESILSELLDPGTSEPDAGRTEEESAEAEGTRRAQSGEPHGRQSDPETTRLVRDVLKRLAAGQVLDARVTEVNPDVRFYILGLSPNVARLAVRLWHVASFGSLLERVGRHYADTAIDSAGKEPERFSIRRIIEETAPPSRKGSSSENASQLLAGAVARAVLQASEYPQGLYTAILSRIRADHRINEVRAGVIKACLLRRARIQGNREREGMITVSLNEQCRDTAYLLGRLFALLEKAQQDAGQVNATIRDRYFGAASATPRTVFPVLLRLAQHHMAKAEYGGLTDKRIESVLGEIDSFPAHLSLEEQGIFVLGYYHQRQALFQKKPAESTEVKED